MDKTEGERERELTGALKSSVQSAVFLGGDFACRVRVRVCGGGLNRKSEVGTLMG